MKKQKSIKNSIKNATLVVLTLLLAVLVAVTWGTGLNQYDIPSDSPFSQLYALLNMGNNGYVQRAGNTPAAYPSGIAMTAADGQPRGGFYNETVESGLYETVRPLWAAALTGVRGFTSAASDALRAALSGEDTICLSYDGGLPLRLLAGWMGADTSHMTERSVISLVLTRSGTLFIRDGSDGQIYRADGQLQVDDSTWKKVSANAVTVAPACAYAGALDQTIYGTLFPETLVPQGAAAYDVLQARVPTFGDPSGSDSLQTLLKAFGYDPYVVSYPENDGTTQVFVENYSSLRVSQDGVVDFKANSLNGGLPVYQDGESEHSDTLAAQIDYAYEVLSAALSAIGSTVPSELQSVRYDDSAHAWTLDFEQKFGGVPVRRQDMPLARFTFQEDTLVSAKLSLRDYTSTGEKLYVLPVRQAAAAIEGDGMTQYIVAYTDDNSGRLLAAACSKDWRRGGAVG